MYILTVEILGPYLVRFMLSRVVFMEGVPLSILAWCLAYRREHTTTCSLPLYWLMSLAFGFVFLSKGFVPSSDPHWTWESALAFQILCDIGAHIPELHLDMVKPNGFDLVICDDLWHALFRNCLVKMSQRKCPLAPSFSSDLAFFSEMLSPPAQGILLNRAITTRVMSHVTAV